MNTEGLNLRPLIMEALGVTALVYAGGWSWIMEANHKGNLLSVGLTHMLIVAVMVWTGAAISGSHYNPAVTVTLMLTGKMNLVTGIFYIVAQLLGSLAGGIVLKFLVPGTYLKSAATKEMELGYPHAASGMHLQAFILEIIGSFMYMYMVYALIVDKRAPKHVYGIAIGGTVGVSILSFGTISGGSLNPARVFGPSLICFEFSQWWIYMVAPFVGCISSGFIYNLLLLKTDVTSENEDEEEEFELE